jgi:peptidyl-prolyl cis-trans isomerase B (cyclophilin B)
LHKEPAVIDLDRVDLKTCEAVLDTDKGTMSVGFWSEQAPGHVRNFLELAQKGFYDGTAFHRVIKGFMIQGGCPNTRRGQRGTPGTGGPGHTIKAEFSDLPHTRGTLSMARARDPDSAGSQFFVVHAEHAEFLDGSYTVFGFVKDGLDVLDAIASSEVEFGAGGERSKPVERIELRKISVQIAAPDPAGGERAAGGEET